MLDLLSQQIHSLIDLAGKTLHKHKASDVLCSGSKVVLNVQRSLYF